MLFTVAQHMAEESAALARRDLHSKTPKKKAPQAQPGALKTALSGAQTSIQATLPAGGSVWGRLVSVFPGRRVRPESAGAQSRVSTAASALPARPPQRPMTERLFGAKGRQRQSERSLKNTCAQGGRSESLSRTTTGNPQQDATEAAAPATEAGKALNTIIPEYAQHERHHEPALCGCYVVTECTKNCH